MTGPEIRQIALGWALEDFETLLAKWAPTPLPPSPGTPVGLPCQPSPGSEISAVT